MVNEYSQYTFKVFSLPPFFLKATSPSGKLVHKNMHEQEKTQMEKKTA